MLRIRGLIGLGLCGLLTAAVYGDAPPPPPAPAADLGDALPSIPPAPYPSRPMSIEPRISPIPEPSPSVLPSAPRWTPPATSSVGTPGAGPAAGFGPFWAPGGYEARSGSPYYYHTPGGGEYVVTGDPYYDHFGPGFHRHSLQGHYRFPYYNYRAPWYYPGRAVYNRDTNQPW